MLQTEGSSITKFTEIITKVAETLHTRLWLQTVISYRNLVTA